MKHIICTKLAGEVGQEFTGPFETYDEAMDVFVTMGPASSYEHKYIGELFSTEESARISEDFCGQDLPEDDVGDGVADDGDDDRADIELIPPEWREEMMAELMQEAADMSPRELAFLLLEAMSALEMNERLIDLKRDSSEGPVTHH